MWRLKIETGTRREKMGMAMSNAPALARWHGLRFLNDGITQEDIAWLLIGVVLAVVVIWIYQRRRRRWF